MVMIAGFLCHDFYVAVAFLTMLMVLGRPLLTCGLSNFFEII